MKKNRLRDSLDPGMLKKTSKVMRIVFILIFGFSVMASAETYSQTVRMDVNLKNSSIRNVIEYVENNSKFIFLYKNEDFNIDKKVALDLKDASIDQILEVIFEGEDVEYDIYDRQIVVRGAEKNSLKLAQQETRKITGVVSETNGQPIPGVSVVVAGTTIGTITNIEGKFDLEVPNKSNYLHFSFVGMKTQEIALENKSQFIVVLEDDFTDIDEVVVVGFGTQKSSSVVSSVAQVTSEELNVNQRPVTSGYSALVGAVPGLVVTTNNGAPGSTASLSVRGTSTTNNSSASMLVIIDNFEGSLADIDPQSIESVSVLKDASAVAIYGARGANGVLLITTKNTGRDRKTSVSYNFNASVQSKPKLASTVNSLDYMTYQNEINSFWGSDIPWSDVVIGYAEDGLYPETNWADELYESGAVQQSHNLTVSGGSAKTGYLMSASYFSQDGIALGDDYFRRLNLRLKIDSDITDWLTVGANALISNRVDNDVLTTTGNSLRGHPMYPVKTDDGYWVSNGTSDATYNAIAEASCGSFDKTDLDRVNIQLYTQIKPFKGLTFEERVSVVKTNYNERDWNNTYSIVTLDATDLDSYTNPDSENRTYYSADSEGRELFMTTFSGYDLKTLTSLTYDFEKGKHTAKAFVAMQTESGEDDKWGTGVTGFEFEDVISLSQGSNATTDYTNGVFESRGGNSTTLSFLGRLSYSFQNKYLIEGTFRADASSYFTDNNKWGYFPSVAVGWVASRENFLNDVSWINLLKLRTSYGTTGDDGNLGSVTQQLVEFSAAGYPIGGEESSRIYVSSFVNPDLIWETSTIFNVGTDASLFDGKLQFEADYFVNNRNDILASITSTATEYGFGDYTGNPYAVKSWGWELNATYKNKVGDFGYRVSGNISWYDNEITKVTEDAQSDNFAVGQSVNDRYGYETDGFFDSQDEIDSNYSTDGVTLIDQSIDDAHIGGFKYVDQLTDTDGDGVDDGYDGIINSDDRVILDENSDRNLNFGLNLSLSYKNFTLSTRIYGTLDNKSWLNDNNASMPFLGDAVPFTYMLDSWSESNADALFPFPQSTAPVLSYATSVDRFIIDAEYIKCQNITLNYDFGQGILTKIGFVQSMNMYVSAENLGVIWTNSPLYDSGWDPELGVSSVDYPLPFTLAVGLNVKF
jgi:TonB-linked SusC/RagA family outer membrane protein